MHRLSKPVSPLAPTVLVSTEPLRLQSASLPFYRKEDSEKTRSIHNLLRRLFFFAAALLFAGAATGGAQTNFGPVNIGGSANLTVTVNIQSPGMLTGISVVTQGATGLDFTNAGSGTCATGTSYTVGEFCTVMVSFKPVYAGVRYGAVQLKDGSGNVLATALLLGNGGGPQLAFSPGTALAIDPMVNGVTLNHPFGAVLDGTGNVYIVDQLNHRVVEMPAGGGAPIVIDPIVNGQGLINPGAVAVDAAGDLFISDLDGNVLDEVPAGGGAATVINPIVNGQRMHYPCGMVIDAAGDLYVADVDNGRVLELPAGGGTPIAIDPTVGGQSFEYPVTLALDPAGDLFIADELANRIVEIPAGGAAPTAFAPAANGQGLYHPYGIAMDGVGNLFIADAYNRVLVVPPPYTGSATAIAPTVNGEGLNNPIGIALSSAGDLYIADENNSRVVEVVRSRPPSLNFAATSVGSTSSDSPQTVQVENTGNAALQFPVPGAGNNPSISAGFTLATGGASDCPLVTSGSSAPGSLAAGATCQLPISFQPTAGGSAYGTLTLTDNNLNATGPSYATQTIALSGNAPVATLSATSLSFSIQQIGTASATQQVTLTNTGSAALTITNIAATGANASSFVFPNSCGASLATGTNCVIVGHFAPSAAGAATAGLSITDNASGSPQTVTLTGTGVNASTVTVTPSPSTVTTAQPLTVTVAVSGGSGNPTPTGSVFLTIGSYSSTASVLSGGSATITVPAGSLSAGTDSIVATYAPDSASASIFASGTGTSSVNVNPSVVATAPAAATSAASAITATTATLAGTVNPNGADTHYWFLFSASPTLTGASQTASTDLGSTTASDTVTANITGLSPSTTYYFQVVAQNSVGTTSGTIFSFTTPPAPYFSITTGASITVAPGASSGNSSSVSVVPWYGFTGTVNLSCGITPVAASDPPVCSVPGSVVLNTDSAVPATVTVTTTAASAVSRPIQLFWPAAGGELLAGMLLLRISSRRQKWLVFIGLSMLLFIVSAGIGCGGGGGGGTTTGPSNPGTTPGTYTITVTGTSGSNSPFSNTVTLTVQ
jgi:sugar lactone lactonase YvrE